MRAAAVLLLLALAATVLAGPSGGEFALDVEAKDEAGAPVADARVDAFAVRDADMHGEEAATWDEVLDPARRPRTPDASVLCGADRRARVEGLSPGRWTFVASAAGLATERRTVVVPGFSGPLRLTLRPGRPLDGRIVDQRGAPIAGATVVAAWGRPNFADWVPDISPLDAWTRADADGRWHLDDVPDDIVRVYASPPGTWSDRSRVVLTLDARRLDLEVELRGPIVGTVRDEETGKVVPGAVVEIGSRFGPSGREVTRVTADAEGRYVVPRWPDQGFRDIEATAPGLRPATPANVEWMELSEDGPSPVDVAVRAGAVLRGRVLDAGRAVAGAVVWIDSAEGLPEVAATDAAGRYAFAARPGGLVVVGVAAGGSHPAAVLRNRMDRTGDPAGGRSVTLPERGEVELDLRPPPAPGPRLCGIVVDEAGEPVPYAEVATSQGTETMTGRDGFFELPRTGDGAVTLTVTDDEFRAMLLSDVRGDAATAERPLVVRLEHPRSVRVRGMVKGPDGKPARGGRVVLRKAAPKAEWPKDLFRVRGYWEEWTALGPDGSFDLSIGEDDDTVVSLAVVAPGCAPASFDLPDAGADGVRTIDVRLEPGMTIRGRVVSAATKKPVAGARILLLPESERHIVCPTPVPVMYASTGDDGSFAIRDLPPGKAELTAVAPTFGKDVVDVVIEHGGKRATVTADFVLPAAGREFRNGGVASWMRPPQAILVDEGGAPLSGWTVEGYRGQGRTQLDKKALVRATTDAEGKFEFAGARAVTNLLAYPPPTTKGGPREVFPSEVPTFSKDDTCRTYGGEIVSIEVVDEDGAVATDFAFSIVDAAGDRRQWSENCDGRHICMCELPADARMTIHVEKPGFEPIDVKDVPAGTVRMRLVLKRSAPK